jgi:hypothetical protein
VAFSKSQQQTLKVGNILLLCFILSGVCTVDCKYPYAPEPEPALSSEGNDTVQHAGTRIFPINGIKQICNPSIAQDTVHFAGCMLWLNFSGDLPVTIPEEMQFPLPASQHDRLTIVDTTNTVRWVIMRDELGADELEELQDPEWAAHPGYIVCLLSEQAGLQWGCYAIHLSSRKKIKLCDKGLSGTSTPHMWVEPDAVSGGEPGTIHYGDDGFADSVSVDEFFGTCKVKVVVAKRAGMVLSLHFRDYSAGGDTLVPLKRPEGRDGWNCESPLISPDGKWIVYNAYETVSFYETYIQELTENSRPILLKAGASDPHWWRHPGDSSLVYVVYQEVPGTNLVYGDFTDQTYRETGELGSTFRQLVRLFTGAATESVAFARIGQPEVLVKLPTKGGLSPDGKYLCTGYDRAFIVRLP